jgi:protein-disulfide isomerase
MEETEKKGFDVWVYLWERKTSFAFIFSLIALVLSGYNTYKLTGTLAQPSVPGAVANNFEKPEKILKDLPKGVPVLGNPSAKLTIVEFADFQCPFCGKFHKEVFPAIKAKYIDTGKVKFVYMDYAFLGQESLDTAEAAKCANEQGRFWEYHDEIYNNQKGENKGVFNQAVLKGFAQKLALNMDDFNRCVSDTRYDKAISDEMILGSKYGISGTPGFLIGKQMVKGASNLASFEQVINSQL